MKKLIQIMMVTILVSSPSLQANADQEIALGFSGLEGGTGFGGGNLKSLGGGFDDFGSGFANGGFTEAKWVLCSI